MLYIAHVGRFDEDDIQQTDWVLSCYLPRKLYTKSPFPNNCAFQGKVQVKWDKEKIIATLQQYLVSDFDYRPFCQIPKWDIRQSSEWDNFKMKAEKAFKRLDNSVPIAERLKVLIEEFPSSMNDFKPYIAYAVYDKCWDSVCTSFIQFIHEELGV